MRMDSGFHSVDWMASFHAGHVVRFDHPAPEKSDGPKADFTAMTLSDLCAWSRQEKTAGRLSASEALAFARMTMMLQRRYKDVWLGGQQGAQTLDFLALAREGITNALLNSDDETAKVLQAAFNVMLKFQDPRPVGIFAA